MGKNLFAALPPSIQGPLRAIIAAQEMRLNQCLALQEEHYKIQLASRQEHLKKELALQEEHFKNALASQGKRLEGLRNDLDGLRDVDISADIEAKVEEGLDDVKERILESLTRGSMRATLYLERINVDSP